MTQPLKLPPVGTRVMRPYGRKDYVEYGEIGTVTAHNDDGTMQMTLDDQQPYHRTMWGSKSKPTDHAGLVHKKLTPSEVSRLVDIYRENAERFTRLALMWTDEAEKESKR